MLKQFFSIQNKTDSKWISCSQTAGPVGFQSLTLGLVRRCFGVLGCKAYFFYFESWIFPALPGCSTGRKWLTWRSKALAPRCFMVHRQVHLVFEPFACPQETIKKMCGLITAQLEGDSVILTGTVEACEQGLKFLEAQIQQLGLTILAKKPAATPKPSCFLMFNVFFFLSLTFPT